MAAAAIITGPGAIRDAVRRWLGSEHLVLALAVFLALALGPFTPGLWSSANAANVLASLLPLFIVAAGQTLVLIVGGIDLSVTAVIALTSVTGALVMNGETGWLRGSPLAMPAGVALMLAVGALAGLLNGCAVARLSMPAFIVTLTAMMFLSGLAVWLTQSRNIYGLPPSFLAFGGKLWLTALLAAGVGVAAHLLLTRTLLGRWLYAVGQNARAAHVSGVPVAAVTIAAYVLCGVCAAAAAVVYTARLETGSPVLGQRILLDVIAATVLGGTSLFGGRGRVAWTLSGVFFLTVLDNALNLLGLSHFAVMMVKGGVIVLAALLDATRRRWLAA